MRPSSWEPGSWGPARTASRSSAGSWPPTARGARSASGGTASSRRRRSARRSRSFFDESPSRVSAVRLAPHPVDGHAEDHERVEERPRDPGDHRHDRRFRHRGPHQRGPPREPPRVRRDEGPEHAQRALDRDAPGVLEVLNNVSWTSPIRFVPLFRSQPCEVPFCLYNDRPIRRQTGLRGPMRDEILSYWDMCSREGHALQRGMYYRKPPRFSIVLMSQRPGAPYEDSLSQDGTVLTYEGHDVKKGIGIDAKSTDQPWMFPDGKPTDNKKFAQAIDQQTPSLVRVYEKLKPGIWSDKGLFELSSYEYTISGSRQVFKFTLKLSDSPDRLGHFVGGEEFTRAIPSWVKQAVYKRDKGQC